MPRNARLAPGDWIFHVLNRANGKGLLFETPVSYREFLAIIGETAARDRMRVLAWCLMPNHWHMLLWPRQDGDLARFLHSISLRHTQRWHERHQTAGRGHLYQSRYKSFAVRTDDHLLTVCRYIERNPLRACLVKRAEAWPWSSATSRGHDDVMTADHTRDGRQRSMPPVTLTRLPVEAPVRWVEWLNEPQSNVELDRLRTCVRQGCPFGDADWNATAARQLGLRLEPGKVGRPVRDAAKSGG